MAVFHAFPKSFAETRRLRSAGRLCAIGCLRVAALVYRSRVDLDLPRIGCRTTDSGYQLAVPAGWLDAYPLTATALEAEAEEWRNVGLRFDVRAQAERAQAAG